MCPRAYWTLKTADQWLSLRLDFIGSCLILLTAMLAISERNHISPSIAALSLSQVGLFRSFNGLHCLQGSARLVAGVSSAGLATSLLRASCCDNDGVSAELSLATSGKIAKSSHHTPCNSIKACSYQR